MSPFDFARRISACLLPLAAAAAAVGLFFPSVYRESDWVIPQNRGQDLVTLLILPVFGYAVRRSGGQSARPVLVWLGTLGYLWYTYTGAAFSYHFNRLFPVYVALFAGSLFALALALRGLDPLRLREQFGPATPRRAVAGYLAGVGLLLTVLWTSQIVPFYRSGRLPDMIRLAEVPTVFVYVLDLGVVVPLAAAGAGALWRDLSWGYPVAGFVLAKAAAMGLALVAMTAFAIAAGVPAEPGLSILWVAIAASALGMLAWFLRDVRREPASGKLAQ